MYLTISSAKGPYSEKEKSGLEKLGYTAWRENGRWRAARPISDIEEIGDVWGQPIFNIPGNDGRPEILSVRFDGVTRQPVAGGLWGQKGKVIMINPDDPMHSGLFSFVLADVPGPAVEVTVDQPRLASQDGLPHFLRVLRICMNAFYQGLSPCFHNRKYIGRARRRYLAWLKREGTLPPILERIWKETNESMGRPGSQIGLLRDADREWNLVCKKEQEFSKQ